MISKIPMFKTIVCLCMALLFGTILATTVCSQERVCQDTDGDGIVDTCMTITPVEVQQVDSADFTMVPMSTRYVTTTTTTATSAYTTTQTYRSTGRREGPIRRWIKSRPIARIFGGGGQRIRASSCGG